MSILNITAIAVALAMDAFTVSIAVGVYLKNVNFRQAFRLSWHFGFFQAMMPVIGWSAGLTVRSLIEQYDHWIAFGLLLFVGTSMIREAVTEKKEDRAGKDPTKGMRLVMLSVATSIDALAVGLSLSMLSVSVWTPAVVIGITAALFTILGLYIGSRSVRVAFLKKYAALLGGTVLYLIGVNILYQHGVLQF